MRRLEVPVAALAALAALAAVAAAVGSGAAQERPAPADLVIRHADVLDVRTGGVRRDRTIVVVDGRIEAVLPDGGRVPAADRVLDAAGGLVTPGLVDVHGHLAYVLGDSVSAGGGFVTHLDPSPDSLAAYRRRYAAAYLPYGVTTVRDVGSAEADLALLAAWTADAPDLPDLLLSGAALVSEEEGRTPFPGHAVVAGPDEARRKVREYHARGYRHLKLYWRLREAELAAALDEARRLGVRATGHVDFHRVGFGRALDLGLRDFEHAYTVGIGALDDREFAGLWRRDVPEVYGSRRRGLFHLAVLEAFVRLGADDPEALELVRRLAATGSTVSTTLHIFAQQVGASSFRLPTGTAFDDVAGLSDRQRRRALRGYRILAGYVRRMHEAGVRLTVGSDWMQPGRTTLSEMDLLRRAGVPVEDVFRIATLHGAQALDLPDRGVIEPAMRADLVVFERSPLEHPEALFGPRTVVKEGRVVARGRLPAVSPAARATGRPRPAHSPGPRG